jgi:hypothetical protein
MKVKRKREKKFEAVFSKPTKTPTKVELGFI